MSNVKKKDTENSKNSGSKNESDNTKGKEKDKEKLSTKEKENEKPSSKEKDKDKDKQSTKDKEKQNTKEKQSTKENNTSHENKSNNNSKNIINESNNISSLSPRIITRVLIELFPSRQELFSMIDSFVESKGYSKKYKGYNKGASIELEFEEDDAGYEFIKHLNIIKLKNHLYSKCKAKLIMETKKPLRKFDKENV
jgi:hypothetical protein